MAWQHDEQPWVPEENHDVRLACHQAGLEGPNRVAEAQAYVVPYLEELQDLLRLIRVVDLVANLVVEILLSEIRVLVHHGAAEARGSDLWDEVVDVKMVVDAENYEVAVVESVEPMGYEDSSDCQ